MTHRGLPSPTRLLSDYGMVFVLLLLGLVFSALTYGEQHPTGESAAEQLAPEILARFGQGARVLIVADPGQEDADFAVQLQADLRAAGVRVEKVVGDPRDARRALKRLEESGGQLDAIACTHTPSTWLLFDDLPTDFPSLAGAEVITPQGYRWPGFLTRNNLLNIANQIAVIAIVAVGMTLVIVTGGIDLSVGSLIALSAVVSTLAIRGLAGGPGATVVGMALSCGLGVALCGLAGTFSGIMVTFFRIPAFIATLSMMLVASGLAYTLTGGQSVFQIPEAFVWLGKGADLFGIPNAVVLMLLFYAGAHVLMSRMTLGRYLYAVGGNAEAARLSGVPVQRVLLFAYTCSGLLAGVGGVVLASKLKSGSATYGQMYELYVIAAVVVGGTSLSGGEGKMLGTLIGAFIIAVIQNGMNLKDVAPFTQKIVLGLVILAAVLLDRLKHQGWWRRGREKG